MQLSALISGLALLAATSVTGVVLPRQVAAATYSGTYNGHDYSIQADDIAHAAAQLATLYGSQTRDVSENLNVVERAALNKRNKDGIFCVPVAGQSWTWALVPDITDGINLIKSIGGRIDIGHECARLSCTGTAGIFLCNDNNYRIQPALDYMASYAQDIIDRCKQLPPFAKAIAGGQEFDSDNYNIIVKEGCTL